MGLTTIVVGVEGSPNGEAAVEFAAQLAAGTGARVVSGAGAACSHGGAGSVEAISSSRVGAAGTAAFCEGSSAGFGSSSSSASSRTGASSGSPSPRPVVRIQRTIAATVG